MSSKARAEEVRKRCGYINRVVKHRDVPSGRNFSVRCEIQRGEVKREGHHRVDEK